MSIVWFGTPLLPYDSGAVHFNPMHNGWPMLIVPIQLLGWLSYSMVVWDAMQWTPAVASA